MTETRSKYVDRPPRIQPELPVEVVSIPPPPKNDEKQQPLWQATIPVVTILGYILISATGQTSNIAFIVPMALAVFISTGLVIYNTLTGWQRQQEKRKAYEHRLVEMRREMIAAHNRQRTFYEYNYPDPAVTLQINGEQHDNRGGSRLWERRAGDQDFGMVRIGKGQRDSTVIYQVGQADENDESPQLRDAERLAADSRIVTDVPITIPLYQHDKEDKQTEGEGEISALPVKHMLGISGEPRDVYEFIYALLVHHAAFHSPTDSQISVLGLNAAAQHWSWLYSLPHTVVNAAKGQYRLYFEDCERITAPISGRVEKIFAQVGKVIEPGTVVARIRGRDNKMVDVVSQTGGRVQAFGRMPSLDGQITQLVDEGRDIEAGMPILRLEDFDMSLQQLEEELDHMKKEYQQHLGRRRSREIAGVPRFWKEKIWVELDRRFRRLRDRTENDKTNLTLPFMLTVVDLLAANPTASDALNPLKQSWLDDLESEAAISLIMEEGAALGACVIVLVPSRSKIPSGCQGVIELQRDEAGNLKFLYAETGLNTPRYVGMADRIISPENRLNRKLITFAKALSEWEVRRSYGADIPRKVDLLPLYNATTIEELNIIHNWERSKDSQWAEWPKIPLGMLAGQEPRNLHFFADADGVHGMIAGSTGSGKSELLMTLILSLAVKYDPRMVNFVLIDFKGGAAFDPFKDLPHVVDIVTNLRGNAVARMFAAINAELNRRQGINQDNDTKDIVRYRKQGLHLSLNDNYPHLFIIIDEFAEMIANNPEYKAQLDSITRLGRALGVSLILAAQRPTGVTDQMRSNIKFRICLRVETREESSELLRLPDANYLPSIPGRGYLQVGSESLELIQVGYTGEPYTKSDYDPLERYENRAMIWEEDLGKEEDEPLYDILVRRMAKYAHERYSVKKPWRKPWPNPLPTELSLDRKDGIEVDYLYPEDYKFIKDQLASEQEFSLCPAIEQWFKGRKDWEGIDWKAYALRAVVGVIDDPANARLRTLTVDLTAGHYVVLGASGWGKSIFLRSVITSLVATHSPAELHLYLMDFGNRSLQVFEELPHIGAFIVSHEKERIERLMRMLEQQIEERKDFLSRASVANLREYNLRRKRHPDLPDRLPAILVIIDNFAEFRDTYEAQLDVLTSLVREGLANGVHFIVTGEQTSAVGKLFNLLPERITLKLSDDGEYTAVVGRGARPVDEIRGRGLRRVDRSPLELQVAMPIGAGDEELSQTETERLESFLSLLKHTTRDYVRPPQIDILETWSELSQLLEEYREKAFQNGHAHQLEGVLGRADYDLMPLTVSLNQKPHFVVAGPPSSGKTTALQTWTLSLAELYTPEKVAFVFVDYQGGLVDYGGKLRLDGLPHALESVITDKDRFTALAAKLENEVRHSARTGRELFVIIDNYDDIEQLAPRTGGEDSLKGLGDLARRYGRQGLHFIICGMRASMTNSDDLLRPIAANRFGLAMDVETAEGSPFYGNVPSSYSRMQLQRGRGFLVQPGKVSLAQIAVPYQDTATKTDFLDEWVKRIQKRYRQNAQWLPVVEAEEIETVSEAKSQPMPLEKRKALIAKIEAKMGIDPGSMEESLSGYDDETLISMALGYEITLESLSE
jgi:DNA segregation ATPase FtsK/SpoIIIE-like protein